MIQRIAAATDKQSATADELSSSMEGIANHTKLTSDESAAIEATSRDLKDVGDNLSELAAWFKVGSQKDSSDKETINRRIHNVENSWPSEKDPALSACAGFPYIQ